MLHPNVIALITVVETGSFTKAAECLTISKARISQQVSSLEKSLGMTLLHRTTRKIRLTDAGESYYNECRRAATILSTAKQQITEDQNAAEGIIKLNSVGGIFAEKLLAPAIIKFMQAYPKIAIHLDLTSGQVDMLSESFDLVLRTGQLEDSSLIGRELMKLRTHVIASPEYLKQHTKLLTPQDLTQHYCLCGTVSKWRFINSLSNQSLDVAVTGHLMAANGHIICEAVNAGLGVGRLNELYTSELISSGKVIELFENWYCDPQPVSLLYPKVRYKTLRVKLFIEFLVNWFEKIKRS